MCFLVAIDLSAPSRFAIEVSALLARSTGHEPLLLHVSPDRPSLRQLADLYALAEPLRTFGSTPRLRTAQGDPARTICEQARAREARFVVMGTRGHHAQTGKGTGSVARRVMATCPIPVIAVRPQGAGSPGPAHPRGSRVVALMDANHPGRTARTIARFLVDATHGSLLNVPSRTDWREGLGPGHSAQRSPAHLVLSIDPSTPTPAWVDHLLHEETTPMVLVSQQPLAPAVSNGTAGG